LRYSLCCSASARVGGGNGKSSTKGPYGQYFNSQQGLQTRLVRLFQSSSIFLDAVRSVYPRSFLIELCRVLLLLMMRLRLVGPLGWANHTTGSDAESRLVVNRTSRGIPCCGVTIGSRKQSDSSKWWFVKLCHSWLSSLVRLHSLAIS
jgi:hypothetical protein